MPNKSRRLCQVVILLAGKYAGKKAVVVKTFDDGYVLALLEWLLFCGLLTFFPRRLLQ